MHCYFYWWEGMNLVTVWMASEMFRSCQTLRERGCPYARTNALYVAYFSVDCLVFVVFTRVLDRDSSYTSVWLGNESETHVVFRVHAHTVRMGWMGWMVGGGKVGVADARRPLPIGKSLNIRFVRFNIFRAERSFDRFEIKTSFRAEIDRLDSFVLRYGKKIIQLSFIRNRCTATVNVVQWRN